MNVILSALRTRLDSWLLISVFGAIYLASQVTIGVIVHPLGSDILAVQTTLSAEAVGAIFAKWEAAGLLGTYAAHYRFDMIHPLWYGMFLAAMLAKGFNANNLAARRNPLLLLPFAAAGCDITENFVHLSFLAARANITAAAVVLGNGAALIKWAIAAASLLAVGVLAVNAMRKRSAGK